MVELLRHDLLLLGKSLDLLARGHFLTIGPRHEIDQGQVGGHDEQVEPHGEKRAHGEVESPRADEEVPGRNARQRRNQHALPEPENEAADDHRREERQEGKSGRQYGVEPCSYGKGDGEDDEARHIGSNKAAAGKPLLDGGKGREAMKKCAHGPPGNAVNLS